MPDTPSDAREERRPFEAEVARLLELMIHAVYSDREVFLRELISNASDALDKLRYAALTAPELLPQGHEPSILIRIDRKARKLIVSDNGIGMSRDELIDNLGTIARSGTKAFLEAAKASGSAGELRPIGQFGVGFYASFMVAERVRVISRRAGTGSAHEWESDGSGDFVIRPASRETPGTDILLDLKADAGAFLERDVVERTIRRHSDHVTVPVRLAEGDGDPVVINSANALWSRPKDEIAEETYHDFYRHITHGADRPLLVLHHHAEGMVAFEALLFVPGHRDGDLFDPARKCRIRLHVRRVFVSEDCADILPGWLRFLRGVVDSEDLPLNLSREMLQSSPAVRRIRKALTSRVLAELSAFATRDPEAYAEIWSLFGAVLKEGLYEEPERREALLSLVRLPTTASKTPVALSDYVARMKDGQTAIWYACGPDASTVARSPQLEGFRARDIEVLLLSDPIDEFWIPAIGSYDGKPFRSVTQGEAELGAMPDTARESSDSADKAIDDAAMAHLVTLMSELLKGEVAKVRVSQRLTATPACLVADCNGPDLHLARMLRQYRIGDVPAPCILEINPRHPLIAAMAGRAAREPTPSDALTDCIHLLHAQARLQAGDPPPDMQDFTDRLTGLCARALA